MHKRDKLLHQEGIAPANCGHCSLYEGVDDPHRQPMTLPQFEQALGAAQDLGVSVINIVGGEPLLRPDLAGIICAVDKDRSTVLLFTNGWHLADRAIVPLMLGISADRLRFLINVAPMPYLDHPDHQRHLLNAVDNSVVA